MIEDNPLFSHQFVSVRVLVVDHGRYEVVSTRDFGLKDNSMGDVGPCGDQIEGGLERPGDNVKLSSRKTVTVVKLITGK